PAGEGFIEFFGFGFEEARVHHNSRGAQTSEAAAARLGIGVLHRGNDAGDSRGDDGFSTGAGAASVIARLECDVEGGAACAVSGLFEGDDLRVVTPVVLVKALAEDRAILRDNATDGRVGAGEADALAREVQRVLHEVNVVRVHGFRLTKSHFLRG